MIPEGWKRVALDDVAEFRNGLNFNRGEEGHSVKVVGVGDFQRHETLSDFGGTSVVTVTNQLAENDLLKDDDLLFVRSNGNKALVGRCVLISGITEPVTFSGFTIRARVKSKNVDHSYLSKLVRSPLFLAHLHRYGGGSSINNLSQDALSEFTFRLPSLPEQRKMAEILRTWDRAIETVEALTANARTRKQALMQQLLPQGATPPKKRLPGFSGDWKRVNLGEIGAISSAGVDKKIVDGEEQVRLLNFLDAYNREFIRDDQLTHITTAPAAKVRKCDVRKGDIFFTPSSETRDDIAFAAVAAEDMPGVVYSYHVVRFRPLKPLDLKFSAYLFQTDNFKRQAYRLGDGSGQRYVISQTNFRKMEVSIPSVEEQEVIGLLLSDQSEAIGDYENQLAALRREKAALMQQLLTGKRRVKLDDDEVAA